MRSQFPALASCLLLGALVMGCSGRHEHGRSTEDNADAQGDSAVGEDDSIAEDGASDSFAFDPSGLFDDKYFDGHPCEGKPTPVLPPGKWDWSASGDDLANFKNFEKNIGAFASLEDEDGA